MKIEQWVAAEHRQPDAMGRYRQAIHQSPGRAAILDGFLQPARLSALRELFTGDGRFEPAYGLFSRQPHEVTAEEYAAAPAEDRFYHYHALVGAASGREMSPGMVHHALFTMLSRSSAWKSWLADILGDELAVQTGMHARRMTRDMGMKRHSDNGHGSLCAVLYLDDGWQPAFGGTFFQDNQGERVIEVAPLANRMLLFSPANGLIHGVAPFHQAMGNWERRSYTMWYGTSADGADLH
jgi:hypothetical protein